VRIIAGEWRGRRISAPTGDAVRPTLDRVREAWMSMVHTSLPDARVLDLFAGSGALGLEALSRGAARADFVENDSRAFRALRENIEVLDAGDRCTVHREDAIAYLVKVSEGDGEHEAGGRAVPAYDVAFADPPYRKNLAVELAERWLKRPFATIFGVEHESSESLPAGGDMRRYGDTSVTIYRT
jgi:16S rRNA (guanine966-N2)-methyltransferase